MVSHPAERCWLNLEEALELIEKTDWQECLKYVRVGFEFRFVHILEMIEHRQLVEQGEQAVSAGQIRVSKKGFAFGDYGSHSLRLEWDKYDEPLLEKALKRPCVNADDL